MRGGVWTAVCSVSAQACDKEEEQNKQNEHKEDRDEDDQEA